MSSDQPTAGVALKPCPFCSQPLARGGGVNPWGRCETDGCWMNARAISIALDSPDQVASWNTRTPASGAVEAVRLGLEDADYLDRIAEEADDNNWQDWGATMRQAAMRIRDLVALTSEPQYANKTGELDSEPKAEGEARTVIDADHPLYKAMQPSEKAVAAIERHERANASALHAARDILVGSSAPQPLQGGEVTREAVARIIDPRAVDPSYLGSLLEPMAPKPTARDIAFSKADEILALISPAQREGEDGAIWTDITAEPRVNETGNIWLAAGADGRIHPGLFVGHRIPPGTVRVLRVPDPKARTGGKQ